MLNVHSLEANLAESLGLEEDIVKIVHEQGFGFVQLRCPETRLHGIERLPMPKDSYDKPKIRENYRQQAEGEVAQPRNSSRMERGSSLSSGQRQGHPVAFITSQSGNQALIKRTGSGLTQLTSSREGASTWRSLRSRWQRPG
jgi:hypothetical protein